MEKARRTKISKPRFNIEVSKKNKDYAYVYLIYRYRKDKDGKHVRLKYSTGVTINPRYWYPFPKQRIKESLDLNASIVQRDNSILDSLEIEVLRVVGLNPTISTNDLKDRLDLFLGRTVRYDLEPPTLMDFIVSYIEERKKINTGAKNPTWTKFNSTYRLLLEYQESKKITLNYDSIDLKFRDDFKEWSFDVKDHSQNTISKNIQVIKQFMIESSKRLYKNIDGDNLPYHNNPISRDKSFKVERVKTSKYPLTFNELMRFYSFDLSNSPELELARDMFCTSAFTGGLRISDIQKLNKDKIITSEEGEKVIQVFTKKGETTKLDNEVQIPLIAEVEILLKKYNYSFPKVLEQPLNRNLKKAAALAGLNRRINVKDGKRNSEPKNLALHEKVSMHIARFTYISWQINDVGTKATRIQKITGQSLKVLMSYEKGDKTQNAIQVGAKTEKYIENNKMRIVKAS